jgi:hypothetical protein
MSCGSIGALLKMAVVDSSGDPEAPTVFDETAERYEPLAENIEAIGPLIGTNGLTGSLDRFARGLREGVRYVAGSFLMELGPYELSKWWPRFLRNPGEDDNETFLPGDAPIPFDILLKRDQGTARYNDCQVAEVVMRATGSLSDPESQILQAMVTIIGLSEDPTATWPAAPDEPVVADLAEPFWLLGDSYMYLGPADDEDEYPIDTFNLLINNNLMPFPRNTLTLNCIRSMGRDVRLQFPTPLTIASYAALYQTRYDGRARLIFDAQKNLSPDDYITEIVMPRVVQQRRTPATRGRNEIPLSIDLTAFATTDDPIMTITNTLPDVSS